MQVVYSRCAGLDVQKKSVVACVITPKETGGWHKEIQTFSFIPPVEQRDLRDLVRHRSNFIRERVNLVNRVQKVLESANIKLASVASDVMSVSAKAMLAAIVEGNSTPELMAQLAKGAMREKRELLAQALCGRVRPHQRLSMSRIRFRGRQVP